MPDGSEFHTALNIKISVGISQKELGVRCWDVFGGVVPAPPSLRLAGEKTCVLKFNVRKIMLTFEHLKMYT